MVVCVFACLLDWLLGWLVGCLLCWLVVCGLLLVFGLLADRIGGVQTLLLSSFLQTISLLLYLGADGLVSLYLVSAIFGLSQGGIIPSYTLIIRKYLPAKEVGIRIGSVMTATTVGMSFGGWLAGEIFDWLP